MHLNPRIYDLVQYIAHGDHSETLKKLYKMLDIKKGDVIIELGSGSGGFSKYLLNTGCQYYGIDSDKERVKIAKQKEPNANFLLADLTNFDFSTLPYSNQFFCNSLLHHLDDEQCKKLIKKITEIHNDIKFVAIEPIRPYPKYSNPIGTLISNMDDGNYIRTLNSWKKLFSPWLSKLEIQSRLPRWPVSAVISLLVSQKKIDYC